MNNVHFETRVHEDGSLTLPAFAVRGLGYLPDETVILAVPDRQLECDTDCVHDELFVTRTCSDTTCPGYTTNGARINIPARLFALADVPPDAELSSIAGDGALVLVAGAEDCEDIILEIGCMLDELGIDAKPCIPLDPDF